jgi:hypothetical protein
MRRPPAQCQRGSPPGRGMSRALGRPHAVTIPVWDASARMRATLSTDDTVPSSRHRDSLSQFHWARACLSVAAQHGVQPSVRPYFTPSCFTGPSGRPGRPRVRPLDRVPVDTRTGCTLAAVYNNGRQQPAHCLCPRPVSTGSVLVDTTRTGGRLPRWMSAAGCIPVLPASAGGVPVDTRTDIPGVPGCRLPISRLPLRDPGEEPADADKPPTVSFPRPCDALPVVTDAAVTNRPTVPSGRARGINASQRLPIGGRRAMLARAAM